MNARKDRDEWLMAQVAVGRRDSLEPLVRRYAGPLAGFIRRVIHDSHRSEELFQEVFLPIWQKRQQYQFPRRLNPWLYALALNRGRVDFPTPPRPVLDLKHDALRAPAASASGPADAAIATETAALVAQAVQQLPPQQRAVV